MASPDCGPCCRYGMRRGEVLGLRWLDIDFKGGRIMLPQTKNGDGRIVYLNTMAQHVLGSRPKRQHEANGLCFHA